MNESFRSRLARLRREDSSASTDAALTSSAAEVAAEDSEVSVSPARGEVPEPGNEAGTPAATEKRELPTWLRQRLSRERSSEQPRHGSAAATAAKRSAQQHDFDAERLHPVSVGPPQSLEARQRAEGMVLGRSNPCAQHYLHGDWRLHEVQHADPNDFVLLTGDSALHEFDLKRAVYLDTETTGLSGGAGVYVYMVGLGTFGEPRLGASASDADASDAGFNVWQSFLPDPGSEKAMLAEVADRIGSASGVVSFFGKSFDRHRLEDKMRIHGIEPPFADLPHLDLYHPLAKLTQGRYVDGRLATMESELVGLRRESDLPGALAPAAWFDYLADRAHRLEGVFQHNLDDVLSLVTLSAWLGRVRSGKRFDGSELSGPMGTRAAAIARALCTRGDRESAISYFDRALSDTDATRAESRKIAWDRAECLRLDGQTQAATEALRVVLNGGQDIVAIQAGISLAKMLEHGSKEVAAALAVCEQAAGVAAGFTKTGLPARLCQDLERRSARLRKRLERSEGG
ncbi:MAG: hypothetical protein ACI835_002906 [Planctomycetota bacterium]|jgi:uncharacterized protein YprB with RNaseH-like and TPR domain